MLMKEKLMLGDQSDEQSKLRSELATKEKFIEEQRKEIEVATYRSAMCRR